MASLDLERTWMDAGSLNAQVGPPARPQHALPEPLPGGAFDGTENETLSEREEAVAAGRDTDKRQACRTSIGTPPGWLAGSMTDQVVVCGLQCSARGLMVPQVLLTARLKNHEKYAVSFKCPPPRRPPPPPLWVMSNDPARRLPD